jgi:hypothetical protein
MSMKLNVGVCRKVGQPDYGSLGASCNVEVELSGSLIFDDPDAFQQHVRRAYAACERAIEVQLNAGRQPSGTSTGHAPAESSARGNTGNNGADVDHPNGHPNGNSNGNGAGGRQATEKQLTYIRQLSGQVKGLGVRRLETLAQTMFGKPLAGLTSLDASGLIDCLKGIKAGDIDLQAALNGAAT